MFRLMIALSTSLSALTSSPRPSSARPSSPRRALPASASVGGRPARRSISKPLIEASTDSPFSARKKPISASRADRGSRARAPPRPAAAAAAARRSV